MQNKSEYTEKFVALLKISDDEILTSLIAAFTPSNPGSIRQVWNQRKNYTAPEKTSDIWELWERADFRCEECGTHYDLTIHHKNDNSHYSSVPNLQVLCRNCNRAKSGRPVKERNLRLKVFKAFIDLQAELGRIPEQGEIRSRLGITQLSGATYLYHFLAKRFGGTGKLRSNLSTGSHSKNNPLPVV